MDLHGLCNISDLLELWRNEDKEHFKLSCTISLCKYLVFLYCINHVIEYCHIPTQLNPKLGRPYFPKKTTNHKTTPQNHNHKPSVTFSQLLHNQTRPNSVCNLALFQPNQKIHAKINWVAMLCYFLVENYPNKSRGVHVNVDCRFWSNSDVESTVLFHKSCRFVDYIWEVLNGNC